MRCRTMNALDKIGMFKMKPVNKQTSRIIRYPRRKKSKTRSNRIRSSDDYTWCSVCGCRLRRTRVSAHSQKVHGGFSGSGTAGKPVRPFLRR